MTVAPPFLLTRSRPMMNPQANPQATILRYTKKLWRQTQPRHRGRVKSANGAPRGRRLTACTFGAASGIIHTGLVVPLLPFDLEDYDPMSPWTSWRKFLRVFQQNAELKSTPENWAPTEECGLIAPKLPFPLLKLRTNPDECWKHARICLLTQRECQCESFAYIYDWLQAAVSV